MKFPIAYVRTMCVAPILVGARLRYGVTLEDLGIPTSLFEDQLGLVPMGDAGGWFCDIARNSGEPAFMVALEEYADSFRLGTLGKWFTSAPELTMTLRRINYGINSLQSGSSCYVYQSGKLLKWRYDNPFMEGEARMHDSLRVVLGMYKVIQHYLGDDFVPRRVEMAGGPLTGGELETYLGCDVAWSRPVTELWLDVEALGRARRTDHREGQSITMTTTELDNLMNIPLDDAKVIYEMVNYKRHYGFPRLENVAAAFGLSRQQFQRRMQEYGVTFTGLVNYVLMNEATRYMLAGNTPQVTAKKLGYDNPQSFAKAFQRFRGMTPAQYVAQVVHKTVY